MKPQCCAAIACNPLAMGYSSPCHSEAMEAYRDLATSMRKITDVKRMMVCGGAAHGLTGRTTEGERNNVRFQWMEI
jgi:hypothetical protein